MDHLGQHDEEPMTRCALCGWKIRLEPLENEGHKGAAWSGGGVGNEYGSLAVEPDNVGGNSGQVKKG